MRRTIRRSVCLAMLGILSMTLFSGCGGITGAIKEEIREEREANEKEDAGKNEEDPKDNNGGKPVKALDPSLMQAVSQDQYMKDCREISYAELVGNSSSLEGQKIRQTLEITTAADSQYLANSADGSSFVFFDMRESGRSTLQTGDMVTVYGTYAGTADISGTKIPQIEAKYIEAGTAAAGADTPTISPAIAAAAAQDAQAAAQTQAQAAAPAGSGYGSAADNKYETLYVINCQESISLRTSPSTSAQAIRQIPLGAPVSYIETAANGFYKVTYLSDTGYALASYLGTEPSSYRPPVQAAPAQTYTYSSYSMNQTLYVINCREYITLRPSPSTSSGEITRIPLGQAVTYQGDAANGFLKVVYNGRTGYALASYLGTSRPSYSAPAYNYGTYSRNQTLYVVNCKQSITLRTSPSTSAGEICQIPLGQAVTYLEDAANGFYKVVYNGRTGYALASYLSR